MLARLADYRRRREEGDPAMRCIHLSLSVQLLTVASPAVLLDAVARALERHADPAHDWGRTAGDHRRWLNVVLWQVDGRPCSRQHIVCLSDLLNAAVGYAGGPLGLAMPATVARLWFEPNARWPLFGADGCEPGPKPAPGSLLGRVDTDPGVLQASCKTGLAWPARLIRAAATQLE
jgi:hypothetical protein